MTQADDETGTERSGMDLYFIDQQGGNFKATIFFDPYFYVDVADSRRIMEISQHLLKRIEGCRTEIVNKEDLDLANHLAGRQHRLIKLSFNTVSELVAAKAMLRFRINAH